MSSNLRTAPSGEFLEGTIDGDTLVWSAAAQLWLPGPGGGGGAPTGPATGQLGDNYPSPTVRGVRETSGPTNLTMGAVATGQLLQRSGANLVGVTPANLGAGGQLNNTLGAAGVIGLTESSGPDALAIDAVPDGTYLKRVGATVVGLGAFPPDLQQLFNPTQTLSPAGSPTWTVIGTVTTTVTGDIYFSVSASGQHSVGATWSVMLWRAVYDSIVIGQGFIQRQIGGVNMVSSMSLQGILPAVAPGPITMELQGNGTPILVTNLLMAAWQVA